MVLVDSSAAFDTVDQAQVLNELKDIGISV